MSNLTVLSFPSASGAQDFADVLWDAVEDDVLEIEDLAVVRRDADGAPKMWQVIQPDGDIRNALSGAFWGLTLGTLFVMPLAGAATGLVAGLASGHVHDFGIDDDFIEQVRDQLQPDTSALFILGQANDLEALRERLADVEFDILSTEMDPEREAELRTLFGLD